MMRTSTGLRAATAPRGLASLSHSAAASYSLVGTPAQTREAYRDLLIFEERLKQNSERLASQRRTYEAFLLSLILSIAILAYRVFITPSPYTLIQFLTSGLLLIGIVTLILFFATGVYSEKIAYAYQFVPQANRALRYFNIYLNTKKPPRKWSYNPFKLFRNASAATTTTPGPALARTPSNTSIRSSRGSTGSSSPAISPARSRSPYSSSTRGAAIPLAPLPPASNPRGEIIFSSKVSQHYRDGYEKYRSDWEEKRRNKKSTSAAAASSTNDHRNSRGWFPGLSMFKSYSRPNTPFSSASSHEENEKLQQAKRVDEQVKEESLSYIPPLQPSDLSDSSSVVHSSSIKRHTRGRDSRTRPLMRSGSSSSLSSVSSINFNTSTSSPPPASTLRRSSPSRTATSTTVFPKASEIGYRSYVGNAASSNASSRVSTPDLIREDEEKTSLYYPHANTARSSPSSSSVAFSASSTQSLLISSANHKHYSRRKHLPVVGDETSDSAKGRRRGRARSGVPRSVGHGNMNEEDEEEDDEEGPPSPPEMSPNSKFVNLPQSVVDGSGVKRYHNSRHEHGHHRASSFTEFLEELREEKTEE